MPWTRQQVKYLESSGSPLTVAQKAKMNRELHADPSMGHKKKGSEALKKMKFSHTHIDHLGDGTHVVSHHPAMKSSKSGAFSHAEPVKYSASNEELMGKMSEHGIGEMDE